MHNEAVPLPSDNDLVIKILSRQEMKEISLDLYQCSMAVDSITISSQEDLERALSLMDRILEVEQVIRSVVDTKKRVIDGILSSWQYVEEYWTNATEATKSKLMSKISTFVKRFNLRVRSITGDKTTWLMPHPRLREEETIEVVSVKLDKLLDGIFNGVLPVTVVSPNIEAIRKVARHNENIPGVEIRRTKRLVCDSETTKEKS